MNNLSSFSSAHAVLRHLGVFYNSAKHIDKNGAFLPVKNTLQSATKANDKEKLTGLHINISVNN